MEEKRTLFAKNIIVPFDGGGEIHLRRPTTGELNAFDKQTHPSGKKGLQVDKADPAGARVALFDAIFLKVVNIEDEDGLIPDDGVDRIPVDIKTHLILHYIQAKEEVGAKN